MMIKTLPCRRWNRSGYRTLEKRGSNEFFYVSHLRAQRRLRAPLTFGRPGEAALLVHCDEILEMTKADTGNHFTATLSLTKALRAGQ